jgi:hypothetical protein
LWQTRINNGNAFYNRFVAFCLHVEERSARLTGMQLMLVRGSFSMLLGGFSVCKLDNDASVKLLSNGQNTKLKGCFFNRKAKLRNTTDVAGLFTLKNCSCFTFLPL